MDNKEWHKLIRELKKELKEELREEIRATVNGKVDTLSRDVREHMEEVEPFLQGWRGGKRIGNVVKWFAGLVISVAGAIAIFTQIR